MVYVLYFIGGYLVFSFLFMKIREYKVAKKFKAGKNLSENEIQIILDLKLSHSRLLRGVNNNYDNFDNNRKRRKQRLSE